MTGSPRFQSPADALHAAIADRGLQTARIGIDEAGVAPTYLARLRALLPQAELVDASDLWSKIRAVKTAPEIEYLRQASKVNEAGLAASVDVSKLGVTQADVFGAYQDKVIQGGGALVYWTGGVGSQSSLLGPILPNHHGRAGDLIRTDGAMTRQLYWADTGRTVVLGAPSSKQKTYYGALHEGMKAGLALVRPGARPSKIFDTIVDTVKRAGIPHYFRFHCGHGIGLDFYETPGIRPLAKDGKGDEVVLEENMIFNIEVPYYELGFGGMQIEETLRVTAGGHEVITTYPREMVVK
jgi:Xaa-Pro aminopeptidase